MKHFLPLHKNNRKGYSLSELLLVAAILVILLAVLIPNLFLMQKRLRQTELDSKAETVYMAVQNRLTYLYSAGREKLYDPAQDSSVRQLAGIPGDFDPDSGDKLNEDGIYAFVSGSTAAENIVTGDVLEADLAAGHWVIELVPYTYTDPDDPTATRKLTAATVYGVFYSEDRADVSTEYDFFAENGTGGDYDSYLRSYNGRMRDGARLGYYGGAGAGGGSSTSSLTVSQVVLYSDEEIMTGAAICKKPSSVVDPVIYTLTLSDAAGHKSVVTYNDSNDSFLNEDGSPYTKGNITLSHVGQNYTFTLTLDDLSKSSTRFKALYGTELDCGTELTFTVTAECPTDKTVEPSSKSDVGNSLFAKDSPAGTANLLCGRHLQNLEEGSGVSDTILTAQQKGDISFEEGSEWFEAYGSGYFNGLTTITRLNAEGSTTSVVPNFLPITNRQLNSLTGSEADETTLLKTAYTIRELTVNSVGNAGLFASAGTDTWLTLTDLTLTGTRVTSTQGNAGGLIGAVQGASPVTLSGCRLYLSQSAGDIPNYASDVNAESVLWIRGDATAGGLVGYNSGVLTIEGSSASTVAGSSVSGGLLGSNAGRVTLSGSYADCYLYGEDAGGLIGSARSSNVSVSSCYAAGFLGLTDEGSTGAGLVNGGANTIENSYTILACYRMAEDGGIDKTAGKIDKADRGSYYSTAEYIDSVSNVYYFNGGVADEYNVQGTSSIDTMTSADLREKLGGAFTIDTAGTEPYKLMGQSLNNYTYPRLNALNHYGDWETVFTPGALVYYEKYEDDTGNISYGFDGGGVDLSLSSGGTLLGDGYGIVYREGAPMPSTVEVYINGSKVTTGSPVSVTVQDAGKPVTYLIYPLPTAVNEPTAAVSGYYERVEVRQTDSTGTSSAYYDFNPHFARTVSEVPAADSPVSTIPASISVRSPRHLYNLSRFYDNGYRAIAAGRTYSQERSLIYTDYDWDTYTLNGSVTEQSPIGASAAAAFKDTYNGGSHTIEGVSFVSEKGLYVGLFGYNTGTVKNTFVTADFVIDGENNRTAHYGKSLTANQTLYLGVLIGYNEGTVDNCAAAGYDLSGTEHSIMAYQNSFAYVGGLIGCNTGTVSNSEADIPAIAFSGYRATGYAGGFVGSNSGIIRSCYALSSIEVTAQNGSMQIAGFAAENTGRIQQSYCATALTAAGTGATSAAFAPAADGGTASGCYYLHVGSYQYVTGLYPYDMTAEDTMGTGRTYEQLTNLNTNPAENSYNHSNTTRLGGKADGKDKETDYPFRAVLQDASGSAVHFGEWQIHPELGTLGIFYWEHEEYGDNNGYKFTYIGCTEGSVQAATTLCTSHDDGGRITEYGYGYYTAQGEENSVTYTLSGLACSGIDNVNSGAKASLESQMTGYTFYPWTTADTVSGEGIALTAQGRSGSITLTYNNHSYEYVLTPHFADAMQFAKMDGDDISGKLDADNLARLQLTDKNGTTDYAMAPGDSGRSGSGNPYEIRSTQQLQYINWNYVNTNCTSWLAMGKTAKTVSSEGFWSCFPYLGYINRASNVTKREYYWEQTHDADGNNASFTPIGSLCDASTTDQNVAAQIYSAYFNGTYNGNSYTIKNLNIESAGQAVGLFGITVSADVENLILYSENNNTIATASSGGRSWYNLGGLAGVAVLGNNSTGVKDKTVQFKNCTVSGYTILDQRATNGFGGTNIGGLAGLSNMPLTGCSAVNEIDIAITYSDSGRNVRVGGVVGNFRGVTLQDCYAGGSINCTLKNATQVHVGGVTGGWFMRTAGDIATVFGTLTAIPTVQNCYTYVDLSGCTGSSVKTVCPVSSNCNNEDNRGVNVNVSNCYYFAPTKVTYKNQQVDTGTKAISVTFDQLAGKAALTSGTYKGKTIYDALNAGSRDVWDNVTTEDASGTTVNGKYSFPGSSVTLEGKNYPFPTVLRQKDLMFGNDVCVHYGEWPIDGAHWSEAISTLDIFEGMDLTDPQTAEDGSTYYWAYKDFTLNAGSGDKDGLGSLTADELKELIEITLGGEDADTPAEGEGGTETKTGADYAEVVSVSKTGSGESAVFTVRVKALQTGAVTVSVPSKDSSRDAVDFVLEITANLNVEALRTVTAEDGSETTEPVTKLVLANGDRVGLTLKALSREPAAESSEEGTASAAQDFSVLAPTTWTVTPTTKNDPEGDAGAAASSTDPAKKNLWTVTGYGYDATLSVVATYHYNGRDYRGTTQISVERPGLLGAASGPLSGSTRYVETNVTDADSGTITAAEKTYSDTTKDKPTDPTGASFYFYDTSAAGLLKEYVEGSGSVTLELGTPASASQPDITFETTLSGGIATSDSNDYNVLTGSFGRYTTENPAAGPLTDVALHAVFTRGEAEYHLDLENLTVLPDKPIAITLKNNRPEGSGEPAADVVDTDKRSGSEFTVPVCPEEFATEGWRFNGWNTEADGSGESYAAGDALALEDSLTLYAQWQEIHRTLTLDANGGTITVEDFIGVVYPLELGYNPTDLTPYTEGTTRSGYAFTGWYSVNSAGEKEAWTLTSVHAADLTGNKTIYADWEPLTYNLQLINGEATQTLTGAVTTASAELKAEAYTAPEAAEEGMVLVGWYSEAEGGVKVLDVSEDGSLTLLADVGGYTDAAGAWTHGGSNAEAVNLYAHWGYPIHYYSMQTPIGAGTTDSWVEDAGARFLLSPAAYDPAESTTLPVIEAQDYTFLGWYDNIDRSGEALEKIPAGQTGSVSLYAKWMRTQVSVTLNDYNGPEEYSTGMFDGMVANGTGALEGITLTTHAGYTLLGWYEMTDDGSVGRKVVEPDGRFLRNVDGITDENGLMCEAESLELFALWGSDAAAQEVYTPADTMEEGSSYLFTYSADGALHAFASGGTETVYSGAAAGYTEEGGSGEVIYANSADASVVWKMTTVEAGDTELNGVLCSGSIYPALQTTDTGVSLILTEGPSLSADGRTACGWFYDNTYGMPAAYSGDGSLWYLGWKDGALTAGDSYDAGMMGTVTLWRSTKLYASESVTFQPDAETASNQSGAAALPLDPEQEDAELIDPAEEGSDPVDPAEPGQEGSDPAETEGNIPAEPTEPEAAEPDTEPENGETQPDPAESEAQP